eukprot:CAMPEP_0198336602 /NCGR_PEP_ID=MMETSP1450-20131203/21083_1 /TAXON_ID=753684 ORGANISM="Madagascaria erythrocladiodes, Strain CCMP3234" /NCGR_SAMPLE_ID=MMETSP1450 /ASSEMBLY_ACC=CAM_ASM_001115 /LENGTH=270 /DNA_ID=CAMNT_0044041353 /DNA_START=31 /DNA_END=840 /DNA_ORIENTATION=-
MAHEEGSQLGKHSYWESVYAQELRLLHDLGEPGEDWFSSHTGNGRLSGFVRDTARRGGLTRDEWTRMTVLDLGCGNGMFCCQLADEGFQSLSGWDYSSSSIALARENTTKWGAASCTIALSVVDVMQAGCPAEGPFDVVHDKGTFDAIQLNPAAETEKFVETVHGLCKRYWIITSCNNTREELVALFGRHFDVVDTLPYPVLTFGGQQGSPICTVAFAPKPHRAPTAGTAKPRRRTTSQLAPFNLALKQTIHLRPKHPQPKRLPPSAPSG